MPVFNPPEASPYKYQYVMTDIPASLSSSLVANPKTAFAITNPPVIPESTAVIGGLAHIKVGGLFGSGAVSLSQTISIQMQGLDVATATFTPALNLANMPWDIEIFASIFSNGTVEVRGEAILGTSGAATVMAIRNTTAFTMSTTGGVPVGVSNQYGVLAVGGTISLRQFIVQVS